MQYRTQRKKYECEYFEHLILFDFDLRAFIEIILLHTSICALQSQK